MKSFIVKADFYYMWARSHDWIVGPIFWDNFFLHLVVLWALYFRSMFLVASWALCFRYMRLVVPRALYFKHTCLVVPQALYFRGIHLVVLLELYFRNSCLVVSGALYFRSMHLVGDKIGPKNCKCWTLGMHIAKVGLKEGVRTRGDLFWAFP